MEATERPAKIGLRAWRAKGKVVRIAADFTDDFLSRPRTDDRCAERHSGPRKRQRPGDGSSDRFRHRYYLQKDWHKHDDPRDKHRHGLRRNHYRRQDRNQQRSGPYQRQLGRHLLEHQQVRLLEWAAWLLDQCKRQTRFCRGAVKGSRRQRFVFDRSAPLPIRG